MSVSFAVLRVWKAWSPSRIDLEAMRRIFQMIPDHAGVMCDFMPDFTIFRDNFPPIPARPSRLRGCPP